jgi:hypothetical protein
MEVNKLESREVMVMLFGLPVMVTVITLASIAMGHWVTARSERPINVTAAAPRIDVNVPQQPAPNIQVSSAPPKIDINVPQATPPAINVSTPPAIVRVVHSNGTTSGEVDEKGTAPAEGGPLLPNIQQPIEVLEGSSKSSLKDVKPMDAHYKSQAAVREEDLTLDTLYNYAEKYVNSYCRKNNLDPVLEQNRWLANWKRGLDQAIKDEIDSGEQSYINRIVLIKRDCFDLEKATPEKIVEGCRLMLRYRDGRLAWLQAMKDAATHDNLKKTLVFLAAGVR